MSHGLGDWVQVIKAGEAARSNRPNTPCRPWIVPAVDGASLSAAQLRTDVCNQGVMIYTTADVVAPLVAAHYYCLPAAAPSALLLWHLPSVAAAIDGSYVSSHIVSYRIIRIRYAVGRSTPRNTL